MAKQLTPEQIIESFTTLSPAEQILLYADLKKFMDEKEAERKALSESYLKVENGK